MPGRGRPSRTAVHTRLEHEVAELRDRFGGLPNLDEAGAIWKDIWYHETHGSTAIEGNTLVLREVEALLSQGRAVGNKELKDYLEVQGYADAAQWVYRQAREQSDWSSDELLTVTEVRTVHRLVMSPVWDVAPHQDAYDSEAAGNWRRHDIKPFARGMTPPDHTEVPALMSDWIGRAGRLNERPALITESLAVLHAEFECIHPFIDGNGRTGRLLLNLLLVRLGYPPAIIQKRERPKYLEALQRADAGDPGPLGEMIARSVIENLRRFILPGVAGPAKLVPLDSLADMGLKVPALRAAASRGRLRAVRAPDGSWRSSRTWVEEYLAGRYKRIKPGG